MDCFNLAKNLCNLNIGNLPDAGWWFHCLFSLVGIRDFEGLCVLLVNSENLEWHWILGCILIYLFRSHKWRHVTFWDSHSFFLFFSLFSLEFLFVLFFFSFRELLNSLQFPGFHAADKLLKDGWQLIVFGLWLIGSTTLSFFLYHLFANLDFRLHKLVLLLRLLIFRYLGELFLDQF